MLFHFSEDPTIQQFIPRVKQNREWFPPLVWAIDQENEFTYYFPRNCPRIIYRQSPEINDEDRKRFFGHSQAEIIVTIENHWYQEMKDCTIYKYSFHDDGFELFDQTAGYYISHQTVLPEAIQPMNQLIERIIDRGIELRITPNLVPLREAILASSVNYFGIHRFNMARPWSKIYND